MKYPTKHFSVGPVVIRHSMYREACGNYCLPFHHMVYKLVVQVYIRRPNEGS